MKTISQEQLAKMQKGKDKAAEMYGLVCELQDGSDKFEIHVDEYQYILTTNGSQENKTYFQSIVALLTDLLERKEKKLMIASTRKDLLSIRDAIIEAREWMEKTIRPVLETKASEAQKKQSGM